MARIITIARGIGSGGRTVGKMLSEDMGIKYYDKELIKLASDESGINERFFGLVDEKLKGSLGDFYSRRINAQHRLVYRVIEKEKTIMIVSMWSHYEF